MHKLFWHKYCHLPSFRDSSSRAERYTLINKALTFTKDFTNNIEFNKYHSRLVAALE